MNKPLMLTQVETFLNRLRKSITRKECETCDCLQGLLTQLELDCPEATEAVVTLKVPCAEMHGCLGCDPCPPAALFSEYLRWQNRREGGQNEQ